MLFYLNCSVMVTIIIFLFFSTPMASIIPNSFCFILCSKSDDLLQSTLRGYFENITCAFNDNA